MIALTHRFLKMVLVCFGAGGRDRWWRGEGGL